MLAEEVLAELSALGFLCETDGPHLHVRGPARAMTPDLARMIREHKAELVRLLADMCWPPESFETERRFGHRHARLYPFLSRTIATPAGPGQLVLVSTERAGVVLERGPRQVSFFLPGELRPLGAPPVTAPGFGCEVH